VNFLEDVGAVPGPRDEGWMHPGFSRWIKEDLGSLNNLGDERELLLLVG